MRKVVGKLNCQELASTELEQLKKTVDDTNLKIEQAESDLKSSQQQHINEVAVIRGAHLAVFMFGQTL